MILEIRGLTYRVSIHGSPGREATVALLHGFAGSGEDWLRTAGTLRAAGHAAIAIDLPGHGGTLAPGSMERIRIGEVARDLEEIRRVLSIGQCHWLGYSMGGRVALHAALFHPEGAASLILESASPGLRDEAERAARRAADEALAAAIETRGVEWFAEHWESLPMFETQRSLPAAARKALRAGRLRQSPRGLASALRAMGQGTQEPSGDALARVAMPMLLLAGERDPKYVDLARATGAALPRASVRVIPGAGHNIHLEEPEAFERAILEHLSAVESPAGAAVRA